MDTDFDTAAEAKAGWAAISRAANRGERNALTEAAANEHPTLLGQIAKRIAIGVVQRADYNPDWKPWDGFTRPLCTIPRNDNYRAFTDASWEHPDHDGRLDCATVVGSILVSRQSFI